jgi:hypothetical protein
VDAVNLNWRDEVAVVVHSEGDDDLASVPHQVVAIALVGALAAVVLHHGLPVLAIPGGEGGPHADEVLDDVAVGAFLHLPALVVVIACGEGAVLHGSVLGRDVVLECCCSDVCRRDREGIVGHGTRGAGEALQTRGQTVLVVCEHIDGVDTLRLEEVEGQRIGSLGVTDAMLLHILDVVDVGVLLAASDDGRLDACHTCFGLDIDADGGGGLVALRDVYLGCLHCRELHGVDLVGKGCELASVLQRQLHLVKWLLGQRSHAAEEKGGHEEYGFLHRLLSEFKSCIVDVQNIDASGLARKIDGLALPLLVVPDNTACCVIDGYVVDLARLRAIDTENAGSALRTHGDVGFSHLYIVETGGQAEGDLHDVAHHVFLGLLITATVQDDGGAVEGEGGNLTFVKLLLAVRGCYRDYFLCAGGGTQCQCSEK